MNLFRVLRLKLVHTQTITELQKNSVRFTGFAIWLDMTPADSDILAVSDPDSLN